MPDVYSPTALDLMTEHYKKTVKKIISTLEASFNEGSKWDIVKLPEEDKTLKSWIYKAIIENGWKPKDLGDKIHIVF